MQNKANRSLADFGLRIADWEETHSGTADSAKQSQFWPGAFAHGGRNAPNKANLPPANWQGRRRELLYKQTQFERKWLKEKRLWCIGHPGELRGSKANPRRPIRKPVVQTKPILRPGFVQGAGARQSRQTNPICPGPAGSGAGRPPSRMRQTNPIYPRPTSRPSPGPVVQTNPICA
jgi:hypothetical protein